MDKITVEELSRRLAERAEDVCLRLLPGGKRVKSEWVCGDAAGSPGDSLKVHLEGQHLGKWRDWANDTDSGDLVDLWRISRNCSPAEAIREVKSYLGIVDSIAQAVPKQYARPSTNGVHDCVENSVSYKWLTDKRKIDASILNRFRVKVAPESKAIVFPCYSPKDELINRSYRTLGEKKKVWQDTGCAPCLFGWQALSDRAYQTRSVILCEGQVDCMTWTQWGFDALSIPNGSGQTWIEYEWDNLQVFDTIYISFDMDGAGAENARKAMQRLGLHRCMVIEIPNKDANDCLLAGKNAEDARQWVLVARPPVMKGLIAAKDLRKRFLREIEPKEPVFTLPFLRTKNETDVGYYPRRGEITLWSGVSGQGKSTFINFWIMSYLSVTDPAVFLASMEMRPETNMRKMATAMFQQHPTPEIADAFLADCGPKLIFADVVGYIKASELFEMMRFAFARHGCENFFIDSLMRIEGLEEDYPAQGDFMNKLQEFVKETETHVHLVAHPRKGGAGGRPGLMDVKGSSLIPNNADNVCVVSRNMEKVQLLRDAVKKEDKDRIANLYDTEVSVEKQRETGWTGRFLLKFNPKNYMYSAMPS